MEAEQTRAAELERPDPVGLLQSSALASLIVSPSSAGILLGDA